MFPCFVQLNTRKKTFQTKINVIFFQAQEKQDKDSKTKLAFNIFCISFSGGKSGGATMYVGSLFE